MELKALFQKAVGFIEKYKYVVLILVIGIVLMLIPEKSKADSQHIQTAPAAESDPSVTELLTDTLEKINGAGSVHVMVSYAEGKETVFQEEHNTDISGDSSTNQVSTVIVTNSDRAESGLIRQINPPTYLGVIVVCQGADNPSVRLAIVDAVSKITGLNSNCISVLKMK